MNDNIISAIILCTTVAIVMLVFCLVSLNIANASCIKAELKPVRYEVGFLSSEVRIVTTEDNMDEMTMVCVERYDGQFFRPYKNLKKTKEIMESWKEKEASR